MKVGHDPEVNDEMVERAWRALGLDELPISYVVTRGDLRVALHAALSQDGTEEK